MPHSAWQTRGRRLAAMLLAATAAGCPDMADQPRGDPLAGSTFFDDGKLARELVEGVVPRGDLRADRAFYTGRSDGQLLPNVPVPITRDLLDRGRERYNIFCSPCHNHTGDGRGMIVLRGFTAPPSFHDERLRTAPDGHIFDVITNGFGRMYAYNQRVPVDDRWAIVAYIRTLQLSQHASLDDVPQERRAELEQTPPAETGP